MRWLFGSGLSFVLAVGFGTPVLAGPLDRMSAYAAPVAIAGSVRTPTGEPIAGAFIQIRGGISSAVTADSGRFDMLAEPHEGRTLIVTAVGYRTAVVPIAPGIGGLHPSPKVIAITLIPLPVYRPADVSPIPPMERPVNRVFDTQISTSYRTRYQSFSANGRGVMGWADNEFGIDARFRAANWILGFEGYRNRVPYAIAGLSPQPQTTPEIEQSAWNLSAGPAFDVWGLEILPRLVFANRFSVPSGTGNTPWTGTQLDFAETEMAGAGSLDLGYRVGPLTAVIHGSRSFAGATTLAGAPYAPTDEALNSVGLSLSYTVIPGLRADLSFQRSFDLGVPGTSLDRWADIMGLGLTYLPAQVQP